MVRCLQCGKELDPGTEGRVAASMSGSIMGDEYTDTFFLCERCNVYTVEASYEPFLGDGTVSYRGPLSREEGDMQVNLIRRCPDPWDKKCRCEAHRTYFNGQLD